MIVIGKVLRLITKISPHYSHHIKLARSECIHTIIWRVVHKIVYRVHTRTIRARISFSAEDIRFGMCRRIIYVVTVFFTTIIECVIESKPMTYLMYQSVSFIVANTKLRRGAESC